MKKIFLSCVMVLCCLLGYAQTFTQSSVTITSGDLLTLTGSGESTTSSIHSIMYDGTKTTTSAPGAFFQSYINIVSIDKTADFNGSLFPATPSKFTLKITNSYSDPITVTFTFNTGFFRSGAFPMELRTVTVTVNPIVITVFYNDAKTVNFQKQGCGTGTEGSVEPYVVPANKYSADSKAAANQLAQNDIDANGQNNANTKGTCKTLYLSTEQSAVFFKNDCANAGGSGPGITYTVPAGEFKSTVSQAAANQLAIDKVNQNGQFYANANGTCASAFSIGIDTNVGTISLIFNTATPAGIKYHFKIIASDGTVTEFGPQTRNLARFNGFPQGNYTVEARTISSTGEESPWLQAFFTYPSVTP